MQWLWLYTSVTVFYWKNKYAKVLNGDVHGTSVIQLRKLDSETYLTYFGRLLETL